MAKILNATSLNGAGRSYADSCIAAGKVDKTSSWSFDADDGNALLGPGGDDWDNYGKHHLGIDGSATDKTKARYKYPFAKGDKVYRSGLIAAKQRAAAQGDSQIENAAGALIDRIDGKKEGDQGNANTARIYQFAQPRDMNARPLNYKISAKANDSAEIFIYDTIGMWGIAAQQFASDLKNLGKVKSIDLRVNSDGGDVFDGRAIYTQLKQNSARIVAHVDGIAASIASLIVMAADEIRMAEGSFMMIHNAWSLAIGSSDEMRRMAALLDSVDGEIQQTYATRTKCPIADIKQMCNAETWMTAQEAVDKGFADVLDEPLKVAASLRDPTMFKHLPVALRPDRTQATTAIEQMRRAVGR